MHRTAPETLVGEQPNWCLPPILAILSSPKSFHHAKSIDMQWNFALGWIWFAT
jgi:hypothetical protein